MAKRIGPEAKIIALFSALPDESKRIVFDVIKNSQQVTRPKSSAPSVKKKSSQKNGATVLIPSTVAELGSVGNASGD